MVITAPTICMTQTMLYTILTTALHVHEKIAFYKTSQREAFAGLNDNSNSI